MRIAFYTLGCKLNQAETESLASQLSEAGHQIVAPSDRADICIANTCTVTHIADRKSRHWLRLVRQRNPHAFIIATGCYAQRAPQELASVANIVFDNREKEHLVEFVKGLSLPMPSFFTVSTHTCHCESKLPDESLSQAEGQRGGSEVISPVGGTSRVRSLIKIQDGCHSPCTYCIVPVVRPDEGSLPAPQIIEEVKHKVALGHKEVILTGTKVGCYSNDGITLLSLTERILSETGVERLRLSSLQPQETSPELLALWQDAVPSRSPERSEGTGKRARLCRHFHLALQSGSDSVLQRMKRRYSLDGYVKAVSSIKEAVPGTAITTDIMVGFPGESDEEFERSYLFCQEAGFANIHVFPFSPRPGTAAAEMPNQVKDKVKKERTQRMLKLAQRSLRSFCEQFLGQTMWVLWEKETSLDSGIYSGLTDNYIRVFAPSEKSLANKITPVKLVAFYNRGILGELVSEDSS